VRTIVKLVWAYEAAVLALLVTGLVYLAVTGQTLLH